MPHKPENNSRATQNSRIVRVRDLPVYYDAKMDDIYRYVPRIEDEPQKRMNHTNWFQSPISQTRQSFEQFWKDTKDLRSRIARGLETGEAHSRTAMNYIRDDQAFLPKVGVVTIAGLGGLLLGHKGGVLRKTLYSSAAVAVALSACYPKQSANLFDQFSSRVKNGSRNLVDRSTQPVNVECKDRILHTTKNANEPMITIKGDYGQGTPADQHLYTTRGAVNPIVFEADKKL